MRCGVRRCNATTARLGLSTLGCDIDRWLTRTARTSEKAVISLATPDSARPVKGRKPESLPQCLVSQ